MHKSPPSKPSPVKGSPKKTKSPPKKAKEQQTLTFGQPYEIKFFRVYGFYLWHARNPDDKNDAFMKNILMKFATTCTVSYVQSSTSRVMSHVVRACQLTNQ